MQQCARHGRRLARACSVRPAIVPSHAAQAAAATAGEVAFRRPLCNAVAARSGLPVNRPGHSPSQHIAGTAGHHLRIAASRPLVLQSQGLGEGVQHTCGIASRLQLRAAHSAALAAEDVHAATHAQPAQVCIGPRRASELHGSVGRSAAAFGLQCRFLLACGLHVVFLCQIPGNRSRIFSVPLLALWSPHSGQRESGTEASRGKHAAVMTTTMQVINGSRPRARWNSPRTLLASSLRLLLHTSASLGEKAKGSREHSRRAHPGVISRSLVPSMRPLLLRPVRPEPRW